MELSSPNPSEASGMYLEPRCRVCRVDAVREKVNSMLACGSSYAQISRAVTGLPQDGTVTVDSVRVHANRHFPVQQSVKATYREIVERRAEQNRIDFVNGLSVAITPIAFYEALMTKSFASLVDDDTRVSVETGLRAAERLQAITGEHDPGREMLRMMAEVGKIQKAVKAAASPETLEEIYRLLDEEGNSDALGPRHAEDGHDDDVDDDQGFDPAVDGDDDDDDF